MNNIRMSMILPKLKNSSDVYTFEVEELVTL